MDQHITNSLAVAGLAIRRFATHHFAITTDELVTFSKITVVERSVDIKDKNS